MKPTTALLELLFALFEKASFGTIFTIIVGKLFELIVFLCILGYIPERCFYVTIGEVIIFMSLYTMLFLELAIYKYTKNNDH